MHLKHDVGESESWRKYQHMKWSENYLPMQKGLFLLSILGKSSDSYVDEDGHRKYLFDVENALSLDDPVLEWEISAFQTDSEKTDVVAQVVLKKEYVGKEESVAKYICEKYHLDGIKFYDSFNVSEVTGKRDYKLLKQDFWNYYKITNAGNLRIVSYPTAEMVAKGAE